MANPKKECRRMPFGVYFASAYDAKDPLLIRRAN